MDRVIPSKAPITVMYGRIKKPPQGTNPMYPYTEIPLRNKTITNNNPGVYRGFVVYSTDVEFTICRF